MSLISNLIARLSLDSSQFDAGAARARKSLYGLTAESAAANKAIAGIAVGLAKFGAVATVIYATGRAIKTVVSAAAESERAERSLATALQISGDQRASSLKALDEHARRMQDLTVYSQKAVMVEQAFALTMGATADEVKDMTEAAIGLASAYGRDLHSAMRLVALARQGETGQLKEMGIVLDKTAGRHQQYLELLDKGRRNFYRAKDDAETLGGSIAKLRNEWDTTREAFAKPVAPFLTSMMKEARDALEGLQTLNDLRKQTVPPMPQEMLRTAEEEYRQKVGRLDVGAFKVGPQIGGGEAPQPPKFQKAWSEIYQRYLRQWERQQYEMPAVGGAPLPTVPQPPAVKEVPEEIRRLNESLKEKIEVQRLAAEGDDYAAERARFAAEAVRQYGEGTDDALASIAEYNKGLEKLAETQRTIEVGQYLRQLESENQILQTVADGYAAEAKTLKVVNEFKAKRIELTAEEIAQIDALVKANERLSVLDPYIRSLEQENEVLKTLAAGREDEARTMRVVNDLKERGIELNDEQINQIDGLLETQERLSAAVERRMDLQRQWMDVLRQGIDGFGDATARAIVMGEKFDVLLQKLAQDIAYMVVRNQIASMITGGLNFAFPGLNLGIRHGGGTVGSGMEPTRTMPASVLIGAPRLHAGLGSDEFPAILQTGEKVSSRSEVGRDARMMGRMVALLERIAEKPSTNVAVVRSREEIYDALRHRDGHRVIAEINARNG